MKPLGLYIHIPFCQRKCPYCDFYSLSDSTNELMDEYEKALCERIEHFGEKLSYFGVDSVYFGGGTPSVLGSNRLNNVLKSIYNSFSVKDTAEITTELNPNSTLKNELIKLKKSGFNRVSFGIQSANDFELLALGRLHTVSDAKKAVTDAKDAGFDNISVDIMLGIPHQTVQSLNQTIDFILSLDITHISAYILKLEEGTPFANLTPPDDELCRELYLLTCSRLEQNGFIQYEISNFAKKGYESRHNLKYWNCDEYLGLGPAAHSFALGKRFFYPRDIMGFIHNPTEIPDGEGGDVSEYIMMRLRLTDGIDQKALGQRFGMNFEELFKGREQKFISAGLMKHKEGKMFLTKEGFLLSNAIIGDLIG
jgi:oxygen-independent coproporphyrinogen-3 oxidase